MKYEFGKFSAEIDATDLAFTERFEALAGALSVRIQKLGKDGKRSEIIRGVFQAHVEFFEQLFGEGTADLLFGDTVNLRQCDAALLALAKVVQADDQRYASEAKAGAAAISGNRASKRGKRK